MNRGIYDVYGEFLSGKTLHVGRRFSDLSMPTIVNRIDYLRRICTGKKVLHIGCLDHPEIILKRVTNGTWLHGIISDVSALCIGIDVNGSAYEHVRSELGLDNIQLLDLSKRVDDSTLTRLSEIDWDLILCPEILEHITNHQQFLENLYRISRPATTLIITVPNAFSVANFINTLRRFEAVNSDHRYWFTSYTLSHLLVDYGWKPGRILYYRNPKSRLWQRISCAVATRLSRAFSDGIIVEAQTGISV